MATHLGVTSTFGVTPPAAMEVTRATRNTRVPTYKTPGSNGEWLKYTAGRHKTVTVTLEGFGTAPVDAVAAADGITPATDTLQSARQGETNKQSPPTVTVVYPAHAAFVDADSAETAPSAEPDLDTVEIVSVSYSLTESLDITTSVQDKAIDGADGKPAHRAHFALESSFTLAGYGDIPVALGTGGAGIARLTGGILIVDNLDEIENAQDCNQWRASGGHCPAAS